MRHSQGGSDLLFDIAIWVGRVSIVLGAIVFFLWLVDVALFTGVGTQMIWEAVSKMKLKRTNRRKLTVRRGTQANEHGDDPRHGHGTI